MRGWHRVSETSSHEVMSSEGGLRLYVKLSRPNMGHQTDPGGEIRRRDGWLYGTNRGHDWAVPESAVVGIEEA